MKAIVAKYNKLDDLESKVNPKEHAGIFSFLLFSWVKEILDIGNNRPLENGDLFPLLHEDKTQTSTEKLQRAWNKEVISHPPNTTTRRRHRLLRALLTLLPWTDFLFQITTALLAAVGNILQPVFLSLLLPELMKPSSNGLRWAYIYAAGICFSSVIRVFAAHQCFFSSWLAGIRWKAATIGLVFKKVLHLRQVDVAKVTRGRIINQIAGDLQRFDPSVFAMCILIQASFELACVSFFTCYLFGWKALSGVAFMVSLAGYYGVMGRVCSEMRSHISHVADSRLNILNSIISGIRVVKMYAWEWPFLNKVQGIRRREVRLIRWKTVILATFSSLLYSSQLIAAYISLATLVATGTDLTPYTTFMILSLISTLRITVSWNFAQPITLLADFAASLERVQEYLEFRDCEGHPVDSQTSFTEKKDENLNKNQSYLSKRVPQAQYLSNTDSIKHEYPQFSENSEIEIKNVVSSWTSDPNKPTLRTFSLTVPKGSLVIVTGHVGCGKSTLLFAILKELPVLEGRISCHGKVAYVGQQPWIFSGTVRDNVLFGQPLEHNRYNAVLEVCDLLKDIQRFPEGEATIVGERGTILSGGQKARVALARALYSDADVFLLDDPLSAVDSKVGQHIFKKCVKRFLGGKTRLIVTHNLQTLKDADYIVVMQEGSILHEGNYESLVDAGLDLQSVDRCESRWTSTTEFKPDVQEDFTSMKNEREVGMETVEEERMSGSVTWTLYWEYIRAGMSVLSSLILAIFFIVVQGSLIAPDWWLLVLTNHSHDHQQQRKDFCIYGWLMAGALVLSIARAALFFNVLLSSSQNLHNSMVQTVLKAPVRFFDTNPVGRILNRFSRDIGIMDDLLPDVFLDAIQIILFCIGAVLLPSVLNPWIMLAVAPLVVLFVVIGRFYLKTSRDLRRLEGVNRSPVLSHFSDTLDGLVTIRASRMEDAAIRELYSYQDRHNQSWFAILSTLRWLGIRLDIVCVVFVAVVVFLAIATQSGPGITALSLVYSLQLAVDTSQYGVRQCSDVENYMTSVERVVSYTKVEEESGYNNDTQPPDNWPERGEIKFENLGLVYYQGGPEILKDVSCDIASSEKVGIVGRTGAGKSSLVAALFRMPQPTGDIIIDGVNLESINIQSWRRAMSVITQDAVLFTGSLRMNLDPFEEYADKEIWDVLEEASLKTMVENLPNQLNEETKECGGNFSVGERQLLCLARALLRKSKIVVLDEATANVDYKTDQLIQEKIRTKLKDCTVITIAHRLNTIIDYDRVLVLDDGRVVEYDKPGTLLEKKQGYFLELYQNHENMES